ncbi:hypothetical protein [Paracidovorax anthurii]|uniref:Uncharacterized protein n=1 Tax=Paracidovorax anthurii TaxID=78229 RepID=A0A328ZE19_9BURK|nr:hypothetical protein [Paracidovorax anthurii]RAR83954.1 hypothetical protein AX018_1013103 [Paracidovorax anthurii]
MADSLASTGAHTAAVSTDPAHLLMQAINCMERAKACLLVNEPMYGFAQQGLEAAQQAVAALAVIDTSTAVH